MEFINKIFKSKAKYSDDENNVTSVSEHGKEHETDSTRESDDEAKNIPKTVINRKKKRTLSFYDHKYRQQKKHPGLAKIIPTSERIKKDKGNVLMKTGDKDEIPANVSPIKPDLKPVVSLDEGKNRILEEFDPLWTGDVQKEKSDNSDIIDSLKVPVKPPRNKINEKVLLAENMAVIKVPELKIATMESITENEILIEEEIPKEIPKDAKGKQVLAKANISYEGLDGVFAKPVINDQHDAVKQGVYPSASHSAVYPSTSKTDIFSSKSKTEELPVFVQPRKNPWNVWPGLLEQNSAFQANDPGMDQLSDASKKTLTDFEKFVAGAKPLDQLEYLFNQASDDEETKSQQIIAEFFAEASRPLDDYDIAKYTKKIEISKIEIYEEDIKRYHQSLKYHRGPVDHDIIFTTVETALNFIEKLTKEREQKKKVSFLPELLEKCLKSKAKREKEKQEQEKKKRAKEANKKKGPPKPKMWLVFNRISKEKVIICTPGEFYDSESDSE